MQMIDPPTILTGKRVLIVEDEMLVALLIEDVLQEFGCTTLGPCGTVSKALVLARSGDFDLALLDVNLAGEKVYPVARVLTDRAIPFVFLSGYGGDAIPPDEEGWQVCSKPFKVSELQHALSFALKH
jgi:CheY-like chemotaxis protein